MAGNGWASQVRLVDEGNSSRVAEFEDAVEKLGNPNLVARRGADVKLELSLALPDGESLDVSSSNAVALKAVGARSKYYFEAAPPETAGATTSAGASVGGIAEDLGLALDKLGESFAGLDADSSGKIDSAEMRRLIRDWWDADASGRVDDWVRNSIDDEVRALLTEADDDGDGTISYAEFLAAVRQRTASVTQYELALEAGQCCTVAALPDKLVLEIRLPPDMPVGDWLIQVSLGGRQGAGLAKAEPLLVLCNPWSMACEEYMPDEAAIDEYVMNEDGLAHFGDWHNPGRMAWSYGQFEPGVLAAARKILRWLSPADRSSPVSLSRGVTRAINTQGSGGVLVGNWSGEYTGEGHPDNAKPPTHWRGSPEILTQWVETNEAVSYGQCWVFAGITTSLLRCLGLGARQVSNFRSAHDTHNNRMIEEYYDEDGNKEDTADS